MSDLQQQEAPGREAFLRLQAKAARQRDALDALNRRVVTQRLILRRLEELGRGLTAEEFRDARVVVFDDAHRERVFRELHLV